MTTMMIPPGYRFNPSDQVLIKDYLFRKATAMPSISPFDFILEKNLYGQNAEPWKVFNNLDEFLWDISCSGPKESNTYVKKSTYVFTELSKVNGKKRIARTAGCGSWHGETAGKKIYDRSTGEEIGSMKMFTFRYDKAVSGDDHWIMHEYSLSGVSSICGKKYEDYVICKITRCLSKEKHDREEKQRFASDMHVNNNMKDYLLLGKKRAREEEVIELEDEVSRDCKKPSTEQSSSECDEMFAAELEQNLLAAELESPFDSVIRPDDEKIAAELEENPLAAEFEDDETFAAELEQNLLAAELDSPFHSLICPDDEKFAAELEQNLLAAELDDDETFAAELEENLMAADMEDGFTLKNFDEGELLLPMCASQELSQVGTWTALLGV